MKMGICPVMFGLALLLTAGCTPASKDVKIVLVAGAKSHGPGEHEYQRDLELIRCALQSAPGLDHIAVELHTDGWPKDASTLEDAAAIVLFSDGADYEERRHPFLVNDRLDIIEHQIKRGCGLVLQHYATILPGRLKKKWFEWVGGYFDYQSGPLPKNWYSRIAWATTTPVLATAEHPISRGVRPFALNEEYYYHIRFSEPDPRRIPILKTAIPGEQQEQVVAWAVQRADGGRGFATTCGHTHANLLLPDFLKLHLNAIIWSTGLDVPPGGVETCLPDSMFRDRLPQTWDPACRSAEPPVRALILTGDDHPAHNWLETRLALREILWRDRRFRVDITHDPEKLAGAELHKYDVVLLNYCNWESPAPSRRAKDNFLAYGSAGGGICLIHFANGAFHFSLPNAGTSDWPAYRRICRRVWDHSGDSGHDPYGPFRVNITNPFHPITKGAVSFETVDELYYRQKGELPIEVLATAFSQQVGSEQPMAWVHSYGRGRVFQTVLGHSAESLLGEGPSALILRGALWAAGRLD